MVTRKSWKRKIFPRWHVSESSLRISFLLYLILLISRRPLHSAALNSRADIIKTLFEAGAKLDARNFYMKTALHVAAVEGGLEAAQMLIELCDSDEKEASSSEEPLRETEHLTSGAGSKNASIGANGKCMLRISCF
jgi:ankyrin repeat protein